MKKITYYEVTRNTDGIEGRGYNVGTGIAFKTKEEAIKFCQSDKYKPYAVMGCVNRAYASHNVEEKTVYLYDNVESYDQEKYNTEKEKQNALNKLTKEERKLLGLE